MRKKLSFENVRLFVLEVLIFFVMIVFLMMKQAEIYGVNLLKNSDRYTVWYLLYWWVVVVAAVSLITVLRYFFIDRPIRDLSIAYLRTGSPAYCEGFLLLKADSKFFQCLH